MRDEGWVSCSLWWCEHNVGSDMVCNCCSYLCSAHEAICRLFERRQEPPMLSLSGAFVC